MARRKRQFLDDADSDSSQSSDTGDVPEFEDTTQDARDERALFEDPYKRKKRKKDGKEDALYGVFAEDSEDERARDKRPQKRSDWTRAPAFVSGDKMEVDKERPMGEQSPNAGSSGEESGQDGQDDGSDDSSDESESSRPPSPRVREEEDDPTPRPRFGIAAGISIGHPSPSSSGFTKAGIGGLRSTLASAMNQDTSNTGYARATQSGGIGSASRAQVAPTSTSPTPSFTTDVPGSFSSTRAQRSFLRETGTSSPRPATPLSATERLHFNKLQGTFGARMLAKMGWEAGTGLGTTGEGIVTPVETKLRPQKMGIAFKGFREKTEQSKAEARRRGEVVSDDEDGSRKRAGKKARQDQEKRSDAWKRPKKVKIKVEHKSYEQIVAEAGQDAPVSGIEKIIDATGATVRTLSTSVLLGH
jgi:tuftelin-interacting protein 11